MITRFSIKRTDSSDQDFQKLVYLLDQDLAIRNGELNSFYATYNKLDSIKNAIVYYLENTPVGCGAFKSFDINAVEIKRMFVLSNYRGHGIGLAILEALELWAAELSFSECVLETGHTNPEAKALYKKCGYQIIPNFGPYINADNSVCMKKSIDSNRIKASN